MSLFSRKEKTLTTIKPGHGGQLHFRLPFLLMNYSRTTKELFELTVTYMTVPGSRVNKQFIQKAFYVVHLPVFFFL